MVRCPFPSKIKKIGILSPASLVNLNKITSCMKILRDWGREVTCANNAFIGTSEKYFSAPLPNRVDDFNSFLADDSIDAILCARGGMGSAQLLPEINWSLLKKRNLPVLGYSDINAIHLAMHKKDAGIPVVCPTARKLESALNDEFTFASFEAVMQDVVLGKSKVVCLKANELNKIRVIKEGNASGQLIPVNLMVFCSMIGTPYLPDMKGKILLLEEIGSEPIIVERMFEQLRLSGILSNISALVLGTFAECGSKEELELIFRRYSCYTNGPILADFPFGHSLPTTCLIMGTMANIEK